MQLYEREQRARHEVEIAMERMRQLQTVTEVALSHLSLDSLLAELLDRVHDAIDVDTVVILLLEDDNELVEARDVGPVVPRAALGAFRVVEEDRAGEPVAREREVALAARDPLPRDLVVLPARHVAHALLRQRPVCAVKELRQLRDRVVLRERTDLDRHRSRRRASREQTSL